uniref:Uncharacterized protein n=1 Tax=Mycena chlorophos TaxID=658473 RepID=A0ABQ0L9K5_MYCCL|nr:predicted protein [Mycena chlorophos]
MKDTRRELSCNIPPFRIKRSARSTGTAHVSTSITESSSDVVSASSHSRSFCFVDATLRLHGEGSFESVSLSERAQSDFSRRHLDDDAGGVCLDASSWSSFRKFRLASSQSGELPELHSLGKVYPVRLGEPLEAKGNKQSGIERRLFERGM